MRPFVHHIRARWHQVMEARARRSAARHRFAAENNFRAVKGSAPTYAETKAARQRARLLSAAQRLRGAAALIEDGADAITVGRALGRPAQEARRLMGLPE